MPFDNPNIDTVNGVPMVKMIDNFYNYPEVPASTPFTVTGCQCQRCSPASYRLPPAGGWISGRPPLTPEQCDVLLRARELIAQGWIQGSDKTDAEGVILFCARGAVREAIGISGTSIEHRVMMHLATFTPLVGGWTPDMLKTDPDGSVVRYNDLQGTTQADMVALFDRVLA